MIFTAPPTPVAPGVPPFTVIAGPAFAEVVEAPGWNVRALPVAASAVVISSVVPVPDVVLSTIPFDAPVPAAVVTIVRPVAAELVAVPAADAICAPSAAFVVAEAA